MRYPTVPATPIVIAILVSVAGCSMFGQDNAQSLFPGDGPGFVNIGFSDYYVGDNGAVEIEVIITNSADESIYAPGNGNVPRYELKKLVNGEWVNAYALIFGDILASPMEISAGEIVNIQLSLNHADRPSDHNSAWHVEEVEGDYRVVVDLQEERGSIDNDYHGTPLPLGYRTSSTFEIHE